MDNFDDRSLLNRKKSLHLLTVPSPILLMTHGIRAVDPVWAVTTLLFSVAKCTGGPSKGGNEAPSSFRPSPPSARSRSTESAKLPFLTVNRHNLLTRSPLSIFMNEIRIYIIFPTNFMSSVYELQCLLLHH